MDYKLSAFILFMSATTVLGQRPFFAGSKPIGYPETPNRTTEGLADRFGEVDGTTPKLPIEANGDLDLIDRLSKLPVDKQPFWFINWQAYEAHRKNPQTYPQRPNTFIDPIPTSNNANSGLNSGVASPNSGANSNTATSNSGSTQNRFGEPDSNSNAASTSNANLDVKPVKATTVLIENKNKGSGVTSVTSKTNSGSTTDSGTTAYYRPTIDSHSYTESRLQQVVPLVPSPVVSPSTIDKPISNEASGKKLYRQYRRPL